MSERFIDKGDVKRMLDSVRTESDLCDTSGFSKDQEPHSQLGCTKAMVFLVAEACQSEIDRLQAIVDKLPKTADGVQVIPHNGEHSLVYAMVKGSVSRGRVVRSHSEKLPSVSTFGALSNRVRKLTQDCYSTKEAAEAAARGDES